MNILFKADLKPMEETIAEKEVGVTIDNKLSFDKHITEKVNKANSIIGVIRRTIEYLNLKTFRMLYVSLVRPHLEYADPVWNPYLKKTIDMIENIQRRAKTQRLSRACIVHLVIKKTNWSYVKTMSCVILELRST